jgi:hypothetical protein
MPNDILGGQGATLLTAVVIVAVALLALVAVFWLIRARSSSTFIRGGRARQPRLAVLDAAAVDTRRRIVLIRRDDVEHLVMIGGPTDVVIESRIIATGDDAAAPAPAATAGPESVSQQPPSTTIAEPERAQSPGPRHVAAADQTRAQRAPHQPASVAAAPVAAATAAAVSIEAEAADVLENARARVFETPSFDDEAFDEITAAPEPEMPAPQSAAVVGSAPAAPAPAAEMPMGYDETRAEQELPAAPLAADQVQPEAHPPAADFEAVLAAELSEDLALDPFDDGLLETANVDPGPASPVEPAAAPEVKPDAQPSRDSLEAEMERLLGDLSRKS